MSAPDFAIIIVNWNGGAMVLDCVESALRSAGGLHVEVVVVDNRSSDDSIAQLRQRHPGVQVAETGQNLGFGRACNLGVAATTGTYVMFLNPDAILQPETLRQIAQFFAASPETTAIGSLVRSPEGEIQELGIQRDPTPGLEFLKLFANASPRRDAASKLLPRKDPTVSGPVQKLYGACLTVRRDFLDRIGGAFDDRFFMYCEDVDICRRIREAGGTLYYLKEAEITHNQGSCSRQAPRGFSTLMQCDSLSKYMTKYHGSLGAAWYRGLMLLGTSVRAVLLAGLLLGAKVSNRSAVPSLQKRFERNALILKWSCFIARPFIPE